MAFIWERISAICDLFFLWAIRNVKYDSLFIHFWNICRLRFPVQKDLVTLLLLLNLIIWFKVTSDLLPVFAILLCVPKDKNDWYVQQQNGLNDGVSNAIM